MYKVVYMFLVVVIASLNLVYCEECQVESYVKSAPNGEDKNTEDINAIICEAITKQDKESLRKVFLLKKQAFNLTEDTIKLIKQNLDFVARNMHVSNILAIAIQYNLKDIINILDEHPEYYEDTLSIKYNTSCVCHDWERFAASHFTRAKKDALDKIKKVYIKVINKSLQNIIKNKDKEKIALFRLTMKSFTRSMQEDQGKNKDNKMEFSIGGAVVLDGIEGFLHKDTIKVIKNNMRFCLEHMNHYGLEVLLELSEELRSIAEQNKDVLRTCNYSRFNACAQSEYTSHLLNMLGEALVDRLCTALKSKDVSILGHSFFMPMYYEHKFTDEQVKAIRENIGYIFLHLEEEYEGLYYKIMHTWKIASNEDVKHGIARYMASNPDLSNADVSVLHEAINLCCDDKNTISKISDEIKRRGKGAE